MGPILIVLLSAATLGGGTAPGLKQEPGADSPILLEVAGRQMSLDELLIMFEDQHQGHMGLLGERRELESLVERALDFRLFVAAAESEGFAEDEEVVQRVETFHRQLAATRYGEEQTLTGASVDREEIEEFTDRLYTLHHLREIGTRTRSAAERAAARLRAGEDFAAVCKEFSTLPSKLHNGAATLRIDQIPAGIRDWAATATPGDISPVAETPTGFILYQYESGEASEPPAYVLSETRIMSLLLQARVEELRRELRERLRREANARLVVKPEAAWFRDGSDQDGDLVLATADGVEPATVQQVRDALLLSEESMADDELVAEVAEYLARSIVDDRLLQAEAMKSKWADDPEILRQVASFRDKLLVTAIKAELIYADIEPSEEELREMFAAEQDQWRLPDQVETRHILVESEEDARQVLAELAAGAGFEELAEKYSIDEATASRGGYVGWVVPGRIHPSLDEVLFEMEVGEVSEPVQSPVGWHILKVIRRAEGQPRTFEQVRNKFTEKVLEKRKAEARAKWLKLLRERVEWRTFPENYDAALAIIRQRLENQDKAKETHPAF